MNEGVLLVQTEDGEGLKLWPTPPYEGRGEGLCLSLYDAVETVLIIQRDVETERERALGLAPGVRFHTR